MPDAERHTGLGRRFHQLSALLDGPGDRFLHQNMHAVTNRRQRHRVVPFRRHRDDGRFGVGGLDSFFVVAESRNPDTVGHCFREIEVVVDDADQLGSGHLVQNSNVIASHDAGTDDYDAHESPGVPDRRVYTQRPCAAGVYRLER